MRVVAGAGVALGLWLLVVVVDHARRPVYDLPRVAVALGGLAALAAIAGWLVIARRREPVLLLAAVVALLFVVGIASILTIGVVVLFAGFVATVFLVRAASPGHVDGKTLALVAALVGLGMPFAALVAIDGPAVSCNAGGGVSTSGGLFRSGTGAATGAASATPQGTSEGSFTTGGRTYRYRCEGNRLVEFVVRSGS